MISPKGATNCLEQSTRRIASLSIYVSKIYSKRIAPGFGLNLVQYLRCQIKGQAVKKQGLLYDSEPLTDAEGSPTEGTSAPTENTAEHPTTQATKSLKRLTRQVG